MKGTKERTDDRVARAYLDTLALLGMLKAEHDTHATPLTTKKVPVPKDGFNRPRMKVARARRT